MAIAEAGIPVMDVDFNKPEVYADPWPLLRRVREAGPIVWNEKGYWMSAHDRVCRDVLIRPDILGQEGTITALFHGDAFISIDDKARHDALRGVWRSAFTRKSLEALIPVMRRFLAQMLDPVEAALGKGGSADLMAALCRPFPTYVIGYMMGVPDDMLPTVAEWSDRMGNAAAGGFPIDYDNDPLWLAGEQAKKEFAEYLFDRINYRRAHPGEDLISEIVHSEVGKTLSDHALMVNTRQLLFAGNETTQKWLGHIFVILARNPELRNELAGHPELMDQALDEFMRWEPIVHALPRGVRTDGVVVAGAHLKKGEELVLLIGAANRDPARYDDPDRLDIHRERKGNLGFGFAMHNCLGLTLARLEAAEAIGAVLNRFPDYRLEEPVRYPGFHLRGPGALEIRRS